MSSGIGSGGTGGTGGTGEDCRIDRLLKVENSFRQVPTADIVPDVLETSTGWAFLGACGVGLTVISVPMGVFGILYVIGLTQTVG